METPETRPLSAKDAQLINRYWRAANFLSVGQIYLLANPLLREPLKIEHVKPRLLGHWGTTPGLNFIYAHLNRVIKRDDLNVIYICGPGHGGPGIVANTYLGRNLHGSLSEHFAGRNRLAKAVQTVFISRRNSEPRRARNSRFDSRRRRTRLRARSRLRRGFRQSRFDRGVRHRRRRSGNRRAWRQAGIRINF